MDHNEHAGTVCYIHAMPSCVVHREDCNCNENVIPVLLLDNIRNLLDILLVSYS